MVLFDVASMHRASASKRLIKLTKGNVDVAQKINYSLLKRNARC